MRVKICLMVILGLVAQFSLAQVQMPSYPKYKEVVEKFFGRYTFVNADKGTMLAFAKKPDGWHALTIDQKTNGIKKGQLFWSRKTGKYLDINFPFYVQASVDPNYENLINDFYAINASALVPYWGYPGWEKDVIEEYGEKKNLSDSLLNALARAHSSYAKSFIEYSEFGNPDSYHNLPKGQNALEPQILNEFLKNQNASIDYYHRLYKQNPRFETFIADIYNVYSNEVMNTFLKLRYFQNEETAKKILKKGLYDAFYIEMAKNYLNVCEKDAILFTNGDMDTYPLLYVQEVENFRKDVLVVNLSLLNLGRYIYHLANFKGGAKPLKLILSPETYKMETKPYFMIIPKSNEAIEIETLITRIAGNFPEFKYKISDNQQVDLIPTRALYFKLPGIIDSKIPGIDLKNADTAFHISLTANYLYLSNFCVLDILATNQFDRPVYFAFSVASDNYALFLNNLSYSAFALRVLPFGLQNTNSTEIGQVFTNNLHPVFLNKLQFNKQVYINPGPSKTRLIRQYRYMFLRLANQLVLEQKNEQAAKLMDLCIGLFESPNLKYDFITLEFATNFFKMGQNTNAVELLVGHAQFLETTIENLQKVKPHLQDQDEIRRNVYLYDEIFNLATKYMPNEKITSDLGKKSKFYDKWKE
jgi:hypothetical protein